MINPLTNEPFTTEDADRLLGLSDQFLEDWEEVLERDNEEDAGCKQRRTEYDAIRPLWVAAPRLLEELKRMLSECGHLEKEGDYDFSSARALLNSLGEKNHE